MEDVKKVEDWEEGVRLAMKMQEFQFLHNELRKDFKAIYDSTYSNTDDALTKPLVRSCLRELFSYIEADLYMYNQYNPYPKFNDWDGIIDKFKSTWKHHGNTFNRGSTVLEFNSNNFTIFKKLKVKRDELMHPKGKDSIMVSKDDLIDMLEFYDAYSDYVSGMMTNTSISFNVPNELIYNKIVQGDYFKK